MSPNDAGHAQWQLTDSSVNERVLVTAASVIATKQSWSSGWTAVSGLFVRRRKTASQAEVGSQALWTNKWWY
ncbi:MAG: hypothetical protein IT343_21595 [Candidatus Melainabacteria bacterium]|nr:hypothetical protein [Candidatus Melainabacteria bacterium]